jgi:hypothetical protein
MSWKEAVMSDVMGPNARKLLTIRMAQLAVPVGGGFADGAKFFTDTEHRKKIVAEATDWTKQAIALVKTAPDNPYGDDDEAIAGMVLQKLEERKKERRG